jgi:hypothetical protein
MSREENVILHILMKKSMIEVRRGQEIQVRGDGTITWTAKYRGGQNEAAF